MNIRNHALPSELIAAIHSIADQPKVGSRQLKSEFDSFGNPLETELGVLFRTEEDILDASIKLSSNFTVDGDYGEAGSKRSPGEIPDILDFTDVVCFGISGDGAPFCLDYRSSSNEPSIIWWDDVYWRKVSPNFKEFITLLEINY